MSASPSPFKLNQEEKKIVRLSALGGMLEFYDFIIYGIFSVYFAQQFFPSGNPMLSVIKSYLVFILGYIARPIGGIIFSHVGDEYGRKLVLVITILLMGISSLGIGLLPTFNQIGISAPILLLLFRIMQGLAIGGELPAAYVYITESMHKKRGTGFGITMFGVNCGLLLGMVFNQVLNIVLTQDEIMDYGWRYPFIFGGLLCIISYYIRKTLHETAAFNRIGNKPPFPLWYLLKNNFPEVLVGTAITAIMASLVVVAVVFMPTYLSEILHLDNDFVSLCMPFIMLVNVITIYVTGRVANHINPKTILISLLGLCFIIIPICYVFISFNHAQLVVGLILLALLQGIAAMIVPLLVCNLFETKIRLTGVAVCYNIGFTLFGGLAPIFISTLIEFGYNIYIIPAAYLLLTALICSIGLIMGFKKI